MPSAKLTSKGQITIPKAIRDYLKLEPGSQLDLMSKITLSHLNPSLLEKLQALAKQHNRSLEKEIESILEDKLQETEITQSKSDFEKAWAKVDRARQQHSNQTFSDSAELLRQDRQR